MRENVKINGNNGYQYYGVVMGRGFIDALEAPLALKEYIENDSRLKNGSQIIVNKKISKRNVTLSFNIHGNTYNEYMTNKRNFEQVLYDGNVDIQIIGRPEIYHLIYTGKSVSYKHSYNGRVGIVTFQFTEPNPADRE